MGFTASKNRRWIRGLFKLFSSREETVTKTKLLAAGMKQEEILLWRHYHLFWCKKLADSFARFNWTSIWCCLHLHNVPDQSVRDRIPSSPITRDKNRNTRRNWSHFKTKDTIVVTLIGRSYSTAVSFQWFVSSIALESWNAHHGTSPCSCLRIQDI